MRRVRAVSIAAGGFVGGAVGELELLFGAAEKIEAVIRCHPANLARSIAQDHDLHQDSLETCGNPPRRVLQPAGARTAAFHRRRAARLASAIVTASVPWSSAFECLHIILHPPRRQEGGSGAIAASVE